MVYELITYNLGKKLTKHLKQTREKLQTPFPPDNVG